MKWALVFMLFVSGSIRAQNGNIFISGAVTDSIEGKTIDRASVSIIRIKDSVLLNFVRTDISGRFKINIRERGRFLIRVTYPDYAPLNDTIDVRENAEQIELGSLNLYTKIHILQEVIVRQNVSAIRFKNDTTEFAADSFKVREGATAEDLIKKFPGFTVDRNGQITFQGQSITTVLVDGEEFFGQDPTLATRNINAADIKKVQLYEKKSLSSTLTGIDDGASKKQMNLVLKDDAKKGYFGKIDGGSDGDKFYQGKVTANRFTSLSKKGIYIGIDNTGQNGMNFYEETDYGNTIALYDGNSVRFSTSQDEFSSDVVGLPENISGAIMYNQKYGSNSIKNNTINNYNFKRQITSGRESDVHTYVLPDSVFVSRRDKDFSTNKNKHILGTRNEIVLDSMRTLNINFRGSILEGWEYSIVNGNYVNQENEVLNESSGKNFASFKNTNSRIDWYLRNKFRKKGRIGSITFLYENSKIENETKIQNQINYYTGGSLISNDYTDQVRNANFNNSAVQASLGWIEPINSKSNLSFSYTFSRSQSDQFIRTSEKKGANYDSVNSSLSGQYDISATSNRIAGGFNTAWKKSSIRFSLIGQFLNLRQVGISSGSNLDRNYLNLFPSINFRSQIGKSGNLVINYSGNTQQPSANQLQPIPNNIDPLNVYIGNGLLKQSFSNSFALNIGDFNTLKNRSLSFNANYSIINNAFGTSNRVNSFGKREITTINVDGNFSYNLVFSYRKQFKKEQLTIDLAPRLRGGRIANNTNGIQVNTDLKMFSFGIRFDKQIGDLFDFYLWYVPEWNTSKTSNQNYITQYSINYLKAGVSLNIGNNFVFQLDNNTEFRPRISEAYVNRTVSIFDASIEKKISKKRDLRVILYGKDILGQQLGFERSIGTNFVSENTFSTVQRHYLLTIRWRFSANRAIKENE